MKIPTLGRIPAKITSKATFQVFIEGSFKSYSFDEGKKSTQSRVYFITQKLLSNKKGTSTFIKNLDLIIPSNIFD